MRVTIERTCSRELWDSDEREKERERERERERELKNGIAQESTGQ